MTQNYECTAVWRKPQRYAAVVAAGAEVGQQADVARYGVPQLGLAAGHLAQRSGERLLGIALVRYEIYVLCLACVVAVEDVVAFDGCAVLECREVGSVVGLAQQ